MEALSTPSIKLTASRGLSMCGNRAFPYNSQYDASVSLLKDHSDNAYFPSGLDYALLKLFISCFVVTCSGNGVCYDNINFYWCDCDEGYFGRDCETEFDECLQAADLASPTGSDICGAFGTCIDELNGFRCECQHDFYGMLGHHLRHFHSGHFSYTTLFGSQPGSLFCVRLCLFSRLWH